uniref:Crossover junction endonuclease MUS81 n=2 Tax=Octopus bimaculoides TaxID=37653 RepID=A0A0L8I9R1_OCTBM
MSKRRGEPTTTMARKGVKKKKILPSNPNALLVKWLKEWQAEANEKGSKVQYTYSKAINSLKKYPLPLRSGNECLILENFGKKVCEMIDEKIAQHSAETGMEISEMFDAESGTSRPENVTKTTQNPSTDEKLELCSRLAVHTISSSDENDTEEDEGGEEGGGGGKDAPPSVVPQIDSLTSIKSISGSKTKAYVPKYRSGAYAVLLTLFRSQKECMTKEELIREAQPLSETSFKSVGDSYYTAWSSVRNLIKKELVVKQNSPARREEVVLVDDVVCIDDDGDNENKVCQTDLCEEDGPNLVVTKATINPELVLQPYTFDIMLLVDNREFYGG